MALTTTREYRWDDAGAPVLNGLAGSFYALAKACFVGTGGVAYGTGADEKPAAGWSLPWDDPVGFKAVFRNSMAHGGSGCYVRVLDDGSSAGGPRVARIDVYESMTDIDTGTNHVAGGWFAKSNGDHSDARAFTVHADERTVYVAAYIVGTVPPVTATGTNAGVGTSCMSAGDFAPIIPGDFPAFGAFQSNENPGTGSSARGASQIFLGAAGDDAFRLARDHLLAASPVQAGIPALGANISGNSAIGGNNGTIMAYPTPGTLGAHFVPALVRDGGGIRGRLRGLFAPLNNFVASGGAHVGTVHPALNAAPGMSLGCIPGTVSIANIAQAVGRLFVERALSWDDV